ncbi:conserved hypothetical protein [Trichormus variabilis ATCC 29413]|uniref:Uncharacterized protein n=2 Tax=Anabaena variabilis TaxID=264691 RepID=Q3M938_TRIV2|nr:MULTISPECIES: hypothetical protein [Nostocaceae]ABA22498.1 conserved hypothetical protein [Trichormus variabilis ATCC 29413]MBC1216567.1 hypothetical protein [Trichormus variabilis ARAD]MBC1257229.1 hypothetical protein [Trichormus variabilis V5]MBC1267543.1 hypothetical protein [Trichormus variabilis FSR]MBC1301017.1 hypothetical protein [Trichormus variabilis N2B]
MSQQNGNSQREYYNFRKNVTLDINKIGLVLAGWKVKLVESVPFLLACAVFLSVISLKSPLLLFCLLFGSLTAIIIQQIGQQLHLPKRWLIVCQISAIAVILSLFWLDYFAFPAQAQFFGKAESFFKNTLTQGTTNNTNTQPAVSLIFNVLRGIFLLYIAVSLIGVINAVRKDEDWQSIARTPLLVVIAVTIADVLTGFVIGDTSK